MRIGDEVTKQTSHDMAESKPDKQDDTPSKPEMVSIKYLVSMNITYVSVL